MSWKDEYTIEELKKGVRNPFYEKLNRKVEVGIRHETYAIFEEISKQSGIPLERIMKRCIETFAKTLQEHE